MTRPHAEKTEFVPERLIIEAIMESNNFDPAAEDLDHAGGFVLYEGPGMRTWLIATRLRLYCIADRREPGGPRILWSISRSRLFDGEEFILEVRSYREGGKDRVDIGYRKNCPFSPWLFSTMSLEERIEALLRKKMRLEE
jgi:hypothetical protein